MLSPEIRSEIHAEIKRHLMVLLPAKASTNTSQTEVINELYTGMPETIARPIMHPFGFVSRASKDTTCVAARMGEHAGNRIVIGHIDNSRKDIELEEGDVVLYNADGTQIRLEGKKIKLGKDADEAAVLGNQLIDLLSNILNILIAGNQCLTTTPGNATVVNPLILTQLQALKLQYITNNNTNILSQEVFVERNSL